jgi:hypothetical protein
VRVKMVWSSGEALRPLFRALILPSWIRWINAPLLILHPPWLLPSYLPRQILSQTRRPQNNVVVTLPCHALSVEGSLSSNILFSPH